MSRLLARLVPAAAHAAATGQPAPEMSVPCALGSICTRPAFGHHVLLAAGITADGDTPTVELMLCTHHADLLGQTGRTPR